MSYFGRYGYVGFNLGKPTRAEVPLDQNTFFAGGVHTDRDHRERCFLSLIHGKTITVSSSQPYCPLETSRELIPTISERNLDI
jgi:hypothetical protein